MYDEDVLLGPGVIIGGVGGGGGGAALAYTGAELSWWWLIGLALVLVGLGLVALSRLILKPRVRTAER